MRSRLVLRAAVVSSALLSLLLFGGAVFSLNKEQRQPPSPVN